MALLALSLTTLACSSSRPLIRLGALQHVACVEVGELAIAPYTLSIFAEAATAVRAAVVETLQQNALFEAGDDDCGLRLVAEANDARPGVQEPTSAILCMRLYEDDPTGARATFEGIVPMLVFELAVLTRTACPTKPGRSFQPEGVIVERVVIKDSFATRGIAPDRRVLDAAEEATRDLVATWQARRAAVAGPESGE